MLHKRVILLPLVLLATIGAIGCGGSSGTLESGRAPTAADVEVAMQQVVLPTMEQLGLYDPDSQPPKSAAGGSSGGSGGCFDVSGFCSSGALEFCLDGGDGLLLEWNYDECAQPDATRDGSFALDLATNHKNAVFALTVDDLALSGSVSYTKTGTCWLRAVDGFVASNPRYTAAFDGQALYCQGSRPVGHWSLAVTGETTFSADFTFDAEVGTLIVVDTEGTVHHCTIDIPTHEVTCAEE